MKKLIYIIMFIPMIIMGAEVNVTEFEQKVEVIITDFNASDSLTSYFSIAVDRFDKKNIEISYSEKVTDTNIDYFSSEHDFNFYNSGVTRGVNVATLKVNPFRRDPLDNKTYLIDTLKCTYNFEKNIIPSNKNTDGFFYYVLNKGHLNTLLSNSKIQKNKTDNRVFDNELTWYNESNKYLKFGTTEDGIAKLSGKSIIELVPGWSNLNTNKFHIYNRGIEVYFYPSEAVLSNTTEFYFIGSRAKGDTTWFDHYNSKEPFFITYDDSRDGLVYSVENNPSSNRLESVSINKHLEEEEIYGFGIEVLDTETSENEAWYWKHLIPPLQLDKSTDFIEYLELYPQGNVSLSYTYACNIFYQAGEESKVYNKVLTEFNSTQQDSINTSGNQYLTIPLDLSSNELYQGGNEFKFKAYPVFSEQKVSEVDTLINGSIGFDYIEYSGDFYPIAVNNKLDFISNSDGILEVQNFSDSELIVIDTVNKTVQFPETINRSQFISNASPNLISIKFGSEFVSSNKGIVLAYHNNGTTVKETFNSIEEFVSQNNLPDNNFALSFNIPTTSEFRSIINSKGFSIDNSEKGNLLKVNNQVYFDENTLNLNLNNNFSFSADINVKNGGNYISESSSSFENVNVKDAKVEDVSFENADMLVIYHEDFNSSVNNYLDYREESRPDIRIQAIDVERIYDTYNYGLVKPHSIKKFLRNKYNRWEKFPEYLTLIGDDTWDVRKLNPNSFTNQYVPSYGRPNTDHYYSTLEGDDMNPEIIVARIPVSSNNEMQSYLQKIIDYESAPYRPWFKDFLSITGGTDEIEIQSFKDLMLGINQDLLRSDFCINTSIISKEAIGAVSESKAGDIRRSINDGKMWTNYLGHGSAEVIDLRGWEASKLNNRGRYGVVATLSCNTAAFAEPAIENSISEQFLLEPEKGFVISMGGTATSYVINSATVNTLMTNSIKNRNNPLRNIGRIFNSYKTGLAGVNGYESTLYQYILLGDPLINLKLEKDVELFTQKTDLQVSSTGTSEIITALDSVALINGLFHNIGKITNQEVVISLVRKFNDEIDTLRQNLVVTCDETPFSFTLPVKNMIGDHEVDIVVNSDSNLTELNYSNNKISTTFSVFSRNIIPLDPQNFWNISKDAGIIRFVDPDPGNKTYEISLKEDGEIVYQSNSPEIRENYLDFNLPELKANTDYKLFYKSIDNTNNTISNEDVVSIHTTDNVDSVVVLKYGLDYIESHSNNIRIVDNEIKFDDKKYTVDILNASGGPEDQRYINISLKEQFGDNKETVFIDDIFLNGFSLVVIPESFNDTNIKTRTYNFWDVVDGIPVETLPNAFVLFLRDSINIGDYLYIVSSGSPVRLQSEFVDEDEPGYIDSLISTLNNLGGSVDSLTLNTTYYLYTKYGYPESTKDDAVLYDSLRFNNSITRFVDTASISLKDLGNSKRWININSKNDNPKVEKLLKVHTLNNTDSLESTLPYNFNDNNFSKESRLNFEIILNRKDYNENLQLSDIEVKFIPVPEIAILKSDTKYSEEYYDRGVNAEFNLSIQNISKRSESSVFENIITTDNITNTIIDTFEVENILPNDIYSYNYLIETEDLSVNNSSTINLDFDNQLNERFKFNNSYTQSFGVREDEVKPWLVVYADSVEIDNGDYVREKPFFQVELYDSSPLKVNVETPILVRINRRVQLPENTDFYKMEIINEGDLKARLSFIPSFELDPFDNSFEATGRDATGNPADTVDIDIFVTDEYTLNNKLDFPNPFVDNTSIAFNYVGPENNILGEIFYYDAVGMEINQQTFSVKLGTNSIVWNGNDRFNNKVNSGIYYYKIVLKNGAAKPIFGRVVKVR